MFITLLRVMALKFKYKFCPTPEQKFWSQALLNSNGLAAKVGQVISQGKATTPPPATISVVTAESVFLEKFNKKISIASKPMVASMGQVFVARIDGSDIAIKMLHPNIRKKILDELDQVLFLGTFYSKSKGFEFNRDLFRSFLTDMALKETDLKSEKSNQDIVGDFYADDPRFAIPQTLSAYCNEDILSQQYIPSQLAKDLTHLNQFNVFHFFFKTFFEHNLLAGDLNDQNWGITPTHQTVIYDYGCFETISPRKTNGLIKLILNQDIPQAFNEVGIKLEGSYFENREQTLRDALFNPLLSKPIEPGFNYSEEIRNVLGDHTTLLREKSSPWVLLFMRSLFSLIRCYQRMQIAIPLSELLAPYLKRHEDKMSQAQEIKVEVKEKNSLVVALTLPIGSLDNLEMLMPSAVLSRLIEEKIDLQDIIERVKSTHLAPQDLFKLESNGRSYHVWIV